MSEKLSIMQEVKLIKLLDEFGVNERKKMAIMQILTEEDLEEDKVAVAEKKQEYLLYYRATQELTKFRISPSSQGFKYLRQGIVFCLQEPDFLEYLWKGLYPKIANKFNVTKNCVIKDMTNAINSAWKKVDEEYAIELFGYSKTTRKTLPTSNFIAKMTDNIKLRELIDS